MIDIIQNNPFRILGVYADASAADIKRNETKIRRYLEVGKSVSFPTDELGNLPKPVRTTESLDKALSLINLPQEKLYYALFWYIKDDFLPVLNNDIDHLLKREFVTAVKSYYGYIKNGFSRDSFTQREIGNSAVGEDELLKLFLDGLYTIVQGKEYLDLCRPVLTSDEMDYAKNKVIGKPLSDINSAISSAKNADKSTPLKSWQAGRNLIDSTKSALNEIKQLLGETDSQYQSSADSLAKQILQCGINYFNETNDDDKIEKALVLQDYALSIAVGKLTKDRCQQNVDILLKQKKEAPPAIVREEHSRIMAELESFASKRDTIANAKLLVENTKEPLRGIKRKLGKKDEFYLRTSTSIAEAALHVVIDEVNWTVKELSDEAIEKKVAQLRGSSSRRLGNYDYLNTPWTSMGVDNDDMYRRQVSHMTVERVKTVLTQAWGVIKCLDKLHLTAEYDKNRYQPNRKSLKSLCDKIGISTPSSKGDYSTSSIIISAIVVEFVWLIIAGCNSDEFFSAFMLSLAFWIIIPANLLPMFGLAWIIDKIEKKINE